MPKSVVSWRKECRVSVRAQFLEIAQSWDSIAAREREDPLAQVERHVHDGARHIAGLKARIVSLESEGHAAPAAQAKRLLQTFEESQRLHVEHLQMERAGQGQN
jgi:hypothetical protein